jgi:hypothetical protein
LYFVQLSPYRDKKLSVSLCVFVRRSTAPCTCNMTERRSVGLAPKPMRRLRRVTAQPSPPTTSGPAAISIYHFKQDYGRVLVLTGDHPSPFWWSNASRLLRPGLGRWLGIQPHSVGGSPCTVSECSSVQNR